ncbi:class I SAM-dependent methyltransferase [bacterium]|nr:class I SAM-dependent methyltransferase [bacterium]MCP5462282.1 class I SAM-dependent methyltransferase [bacterium]
MKAFEHTDTYFNRILNEIYEKSPLQKKRIQTYLASRTEKYFTAAEQFSRDYLSYIEFVKIPLSYVVDAYLQLCSDALKCQKYFMKTGKYPLEFAADVYDELYNDPVRMRSHMIGLALSQFLWPSHYEMHLLFDTALADRAATVKTYLEIGPGHGLYLRKAIARLNLNTRFTAVDISSESIGITRSLLQFFNPECTAIDYITQDMLKLDFPDGYDFITMGEVLEHVNYPDKLLTKLCSLLRPSGRSFISTCVNAPSIDHVYHFKSVEQIRDMAESCGLEILDERILPVDNLPLEQIIEMKLTINWCAVVKKTGDT